MTFLAELLALLLIAPAPARAQDNEQTRAKLIAHEAAICSNDTLNTPASSKGALEAQAPCVNCTKPAGDGLASLGDQARLTLLVANVVAEPDQDARRKRDLAFYRFLEKSDSIHWRGLDQSTPTIESLTESIAKQEALVEPKRVAIKRAEENVAKARAMHEALKAAPDMLPSPEVRELLIERFTGDRAARMDWKKHNEPKIKRLKAQIDLAKETKKPVPSHFYSWGPGGKYRSAKSVYEASVEQLQQADRTIQQFDTANAWLSGNSEAAFDEETKKALLERTRSALQHFSGGLNIYRRELEHVEKTLAKHRGNLAHLKERAALDASTPEAKEQAELSAFEARARYLVNEVSGNRGYKTCGMSVAEIAAIKLYTGSAYHPLNKAIRSGLTESVKPFMDVLNSALAKLKPYPGMVYRGADLPKERIEQHEPGEIVNYPGYTSTSAQLSHSGADQFVIHGKSGLYIAPFSGIHHEYEVLFPPNTRFKVLSREKTDKGHAYVLEEVAP
jgi:hypothetical protein